MFILAVQQLETASVGLSPTPTTRSASPTPVWGPREVPSPLLLLTGAHLISSVVHLLYCFFSLVVFVGPEVPFYIYSPLPPLRGQPTVEYHPGWQPIQGLAVHCRLGRLPDLNLGLQVYSLVSLPMSHHCSPACCIVFEVNINSYCSLIVAEVVDLSFITEIV